MAAVARASAGRRCQWNVLICTVDTHRIQSDTVQFAGTWYVDVLTCAQGVTQESRQLSTSMLWPEHQGHFILRSSVRSALVRVHN